MNDINSLKFRLRGQELNPLSSDGFVLLHHQHKGADGTSLNGRDGHHGGLLDHIELQLDVGKLIGKQPPLFVVQLGFEFQGRGAQIDGVVGGLNHAFGQDLSLISVPGDNGQALPAVEFSLDQAHVHLRHRKHHRHGLGLGDGDQSRRIP